MTNWLVPSAKALARWLERVLAIAIVVAFAVFSVRSVQVLAAMDWRRTETFYEVIYRILLLVIGIELARALVTHELAAVLELVAFVIARKLLKPDLGALDILFSVSAFVGLLAARRYLLRPRQRHARAPSTRAGDPVAPGVRT